jgi:hypothetical protein
MTETDRFPTAEELLARVRALDPAASQAAVDRYLREIREATVQLASVDGNSEPFPVAFSPDWENAEIVP